MISWAMVVWSPCWSFSPLWLSGSFFCYSASPVFYVDKYDVIWCPQSAQKKKERGKSVVSGLNGLRLILGTVIDTYMEEAQEELRSKRVKQSKGWDSMPTAFGTPRLSTQMWQVSCGPFPCWTFETKEWPPVELHRKISCAGIIKTLLRSADDGWFGSYAFCIFLPFSFKLVWTQENCDRKPSNDCCRNFGHQILHLSDTWSLVTWMFLERWRKLGCSWMLLITPWCVCQCWNQNKSEKQSSWQNHSINHPLRSSVE